MNNETAIILPPTAELMRQATDVAGVCRDIVSKTALSIQGRKYVRVEGWMSIATAHGCIASAGAVEKVDGGFRCMASINRISDGHQLCTGEGFVGEDEPTWFGGISPSGKTLPKRPDYAIRAMCQTRAISRACRTAFAHVVVLMDAGLQTTPAEEVPEGDFDDIKQAISVAPPAPSHRQEVEIPRDPPAHSPGWRSFTVPKFIKKYAGRTMGEMGGRDVLWWAENYTPKPYQGVVQEADIEFRAALDAAKRDLAPASVPAETGNNSDEPPF